MKPTSARPPAPAALPELPHVGKLHWKVLLKWLRQDGVISAAEAEKTGQRFAAGDSVQHPLVRLAGAGLTQLSNGKVLDVERLTEWLAGRCGLP